MTINTGTLILVAIILFLLWSKQGTQNDERWQFKDCDGEEQWVSVSRYVRRN